MLDFNKIEEERQKQEEQKRLVDLYTISCEEIQYVGYEYASSYWK